MHTLSELVLPITWTIADWDNDCLWPEGLIFLRPTAPEFTLETFPPCMVVREEFRFHNVLAMWKEPDQRVVLVSRIYTLWNWLTVMKFWEAFGQPQAPPELLEWAERAQEGLRCDYPQELGEYTQRVQWAARHADYQDWKTIWDFPYELRWAFRGWLHKAGLDWKNPHVQARVRPQFGPLELGE